MKLRIVGRNIFAYSSYYDAYVILKPDELYLIKSLGQGLLDTRTNLQTECVVCADDEK